MIEPRMDITKDELNLILSGIADDGTIGKDAEEALLARINEGRTKGYLMGEVKRQLRCNVSAAEGKKIAEAIDKLW